MSKISETILFDLIILLGAISSASILLETSTAKTKSTPSLLTVFNSVPILGLTNAKTNKIIAMDLIKNLRNGFLFEISGLKNSIVFESKYFFFTVLCQFLLKIKIKNKIGNKTKKYINDISSN